MGCLMEQLKLILALYFIYMKPDLLISAFIKERPYFHYVDGMTLEHSNVLQHKPMSTRIKISLETCLVFGRGQM
jgi:hypothetical protein